MEGAKGAPAGVWRKDVPPEAIERELAALWRQAACADRPMTRAVMSNLIVLTDWAHAAACEPTGALSLDLPEAARLHPSRVILVVHGERPGSCSLMPASVSIREFGGDGFRFGVEQILIRSKGDGRSLPSLLHRLMIGALPTSIWWAGSAPPAGSLFEAGIAAARQLVYDSLDWPDPAETFRAVDSLAQAGVPSARTRRAGVKDVTHPVDLADLAWQRLTPFRRALVSALQTERRTRRPRDVTIRGRRGAAALSWLLAGWIASRLQLRPLRIDASGSSDIVFRTSSGQMTIGIELSESPDLSLRMEFDDGVRLDAVWDGIEVSIACGPDRAPYRIAASPKSRPEMLAAELHNLRVDTVLHEAVRAAAAMLASGT